MPRALQDTAFSIHSLRLEMKAVLPEYMVPAAFVMMDAFPLTANDKVDYKQLPAPDVASGEGEDAFIAPRTQFEEILMELWCDVLSVPRVGVNQNFFEAAALLHAIMPALLRAIMPTLLRAIMPALLRAIMPARDMSISLLWPSHYDALAPACAHWPPPRPTRAPCDPPW